MNRERKALLVLIIMSVFSSGILLLSCGENSMDGMIILTLAPKNFQINIDRDSSGFITQSKIAAIIPKSPGGALRVLTDNYYSAMSPVVSYDSKNLIFTAQLKQNNSWQIFEMNLNNRKVRQITNSKENCADPAYLPNGRIVFSRIDVDRRVKSGSSLYTCKDDGSDLKRITFNPCSYSYMNVLADGRILTVNRQVYPEKGDQQFMVLRPDGTKAELFYKGMSGSILKSKGYETESGKLVFIESESNSSGENIISINYNRPLHTRVNLTEGKSGNYSSVLPLVSGKLLVSWRPSESERYGLFEFDPLNKTLGEAIFKSNDYDVLEATVIGMHENPKKLPSEVDMGVKTGLLLCQDVNIMDSNSEGYSFVIHKAIAIEVMGKDSSLGVVPVAKDGSFYLKVTADTPFQIRLLDEKGVVLHQTCGWIWLRPNERRGCVGCHEDHEQVPDNRIPLAVKKAPVSIPVHITKVNEKKVELE